MGQKYLRMKEQKPRWVRKQDVAKGGGLEPKVNVFNIDVKLWRHGEETNATQTITDGDDAPGWRRLWATFWKFL